MFRDIVVVELELIKSQYSSDAGTNSTALSSGAPSPQLVRHTIPALARHETVASPQYQVSHSSKYQIIMYFCFLPNSAVED